MYSGFASRSRTKVINYSIIKTMQQSPDIINLGDAKKGDTFDRFEVTRTLLNGSALDMTGGRVVMAFKINRELRKPDLELTTDAGLVWVDQSIGAFRVEAFIMNLPVGSYTFEVTYHLANGRVHTLVNGSLTVTQNIND